MFFKNPMEELLILEKKGIPITIIGLPYVGKTTLVNWLKDENFTRPKPSVGVNFEQIKIGDLTFNVFDISGQKSYRSAIWKSYVMTSVGIIFVIDSTDKEQIDEVAKWFWIMVDEWLKGNYSDKVILFLANKADLKNTLNLEYIIDKLNLTKMSNYSDLSFQIFKTSIRENQNIEYAMKWFTKKVKQLIELQSKAPESVLISDTSGNIVSLYDPNSIVEDPSMFVGYLKALSGFTNELLGHEKFKVIKVDPYFYFMTEEGDYCISIAVKDELTLPEARRVSFLIQDYLIKNKKNLDHKKLDEYIYSLFS
ncbi:MAG: ADP-ribosylation factor-like protein [Candidatus Heimdallarchaeaceae archaeon]